MASRSVLLRVVIRLTYRVVRTAKNIRGNVQALGPGLLLMVALTVAWASFAMAQISEFDEPPSAAHRVQPERPAPDATILAPVDHPAVANPPPAPVYHGAPKVGTTPAPTAARSGAAEFPYTVRPGDSLGSIAQAFGLEVEDVARANHLSVDSVLMSGRTLKIPNPFAAQVRSLSAQIEALRAAADSADEKIAAANLKARTAEDKLDTLTSDNDELRHEVAALPRWRGATVTLGIIALLMFGVLMLTLFEWWLLRRRFSTLAEITDSLTNLDQKYKGLVAKAELRFQQLYGRRRIPGVEAAERGKSAEEVEIERLNHELREALEQQLRRLGVARLHPRRGGRWRDLFSDVEPPVEARSVRR
jgi:LysM repeat protein